MECKVDKVGMGRQGVMNGCWEDNNRMGWRGKELGDMEMERNDGGDGGWRTGDEQGTEDGGQGKHNKCPGIIRSKASQNERTKDQIKNKGKVKWYMTII